MGLTVYFKKGSFFFTFCRFGFIDAGRKLHVVMAGRLKSRRKIVARQFRRAFCAEALVVTPLRVLHPLVRNLAQQSALDPRSRWLKIDWHFVRPMLVQLWHFCTYCFVVRKNCSCKPQVLLL